MEKKNSKPLGYVEHAWLNPYDPHTVAKSHHGISRVLQNLPGATEDVISLETSLSRWMHWSYISSTQRYTRISTRTSSTISRIPPKKMKYQKEILQTHEISKIKTKRIRPKSPRKKNPVPHLPHFTSTAASRATSSPQLQQFTLGGYILYNTTSYDRMIIHYQKLYLSGTFPHSIFSVIAICLYMCTVHIVYLDQTNNAYNVSWYLHEKKRSKSEAIRFFVTKKRWKSWMLRTSWKMHYC